MAPHRLYMVNLVCSLADHGGATDHTTESVPHQCLVPQGFPSRRTVERVLPLVLSAGHAASKAKPAADGSGRDLGVRLETQISNLNERLNLCGTQVSTTNYRMEGHGIAERSLA